MLVCRVERKYSLKRSPRRLPVSPMQIVLQVRHLITYTTFWLIQVYLEVMVMHPPGVLINNRAEIVEVVDLFNLDVS